MSLRRSFRKPNHGWRPMMKCPKRSETPADFRRRSSAAPVVTLIVEDQAPPKIPVEDQSKIQQLYNEHDAWANTDRSNMTPEQIHQERDRYDALVGKITPFLNQYGVNAMNILCRVTIHGGADDDRSILKHNWTEREIAQADQERALQLSRKRYFFHDIDNKLRKLLWSADSAAETKRIQQLLKKNKLSKDAVDKELDALERRYFRGSRKHRPRSRFGGVDQGEQGEDDDNVKQWAKQFNKQSPAESKEEEDITPQELSQWSKQVDTNVQEAEQQGISSADQRKLLELWAQLRLNEQEIAKLQQRRSNGGEVAEARDQDRLNDLRNTDTPRINALLKQLYQKYALNWKEMCTLHNKFLASGATPGGGIGGLLSKVSKFAQEKGAGVGGFLSNVGKYAGQGTNLLKNLYPLTESA